MDEGRRNSKVKSQVIHTKRGDIEYCTVGKGIPILFLHGGHSNCMETLCQKGFNREKFQLITPSRPGYGRTPLNGNQTPKQSAGLILELLNELSIENVVVYGISAGGFTAIELAGNYPDKVRKLILASAISKKWLDEQEKIYKTAKILFNPKMEKFTWFMVKFFSGIFPNMIARSFYKQFSDHPLHKLKKDDARELISALNHYNSKTGFLNDIRQNIEEEILTKIKCPTVIVHSKNDKSVPFEHAIHANKMITYSELVEVNNQWGHLFWIGDDSKKNIEKIIGFIEK